MIAVRRLLLAAVVLGLAGCGALGRFDVPLSTTTVVPSALSGHLGVPDTSTFGGSARQTIGNHGVRPEQIDSVRLASGSVTIRAEPSHLATLFESFELHAVADDLPRVRIASAPDLMAPSPVALAIDDVELRPYATSESFAVELDAIRRPGQPRSATEMQLDLVLRVELATP